MPPEKVKDLHNQTNANATVTETATLDERVNEVLQSLGISNGKINAAPATALERGATFKITGIEPVGDTHAKNFIPLVFITDKGAMIGVKNFANISNSEEGDNLGRTAESVVKYYLKHKDTTVYKVARKTEGEERTLYDYDDAGNRTPRMENGEEVKYTPKTYTLEIV